MVNEMVRWCRVNEMVNEMVRRSDGDRNGEKEQCMGGVEVNVIVNGRYNGGDVVNVR